MGFRLRASAITFAAALAAGCTTYGLDDGYGYGGVSVGFGAGYGGYYDPWYGSPYWGWYGDYYYPGTGFYVYDVGGRRHHWNDDTRRHWTSRREVWRGRSGDGDLRETWRDFARNRRVEGRAERTDRQAVGVERGTVEVRPNSSDLGGGRRMVGEAQTGGSPTVTSRIRSDRGTVRGVQVDRPTLRGGSRSMRGSSRPTTGFRSTRPD